MKKRISALGQYIVKQTGKPFNFKLVKTSTIYKGILFTVGADDYLITDDRRELLGTIEVIEMKTAIDYPTKLARKYTHAKFDKIGKKKEDSIVVDGVRYIIIKL